MEILKLSEIAAACGGSYSKECDINGVCIDTRKITKGCLFICIKGERFDGHSFIRQAYESGAAAVMIHGGEEPQGSYVRVENTSAALLALSGYYRRRFKIPVVGLTGSVGKTTTKEFTYLVAASKYNTVKTQGNLNNEIGMPQTLFQLDGKTQAAVIEMGMNHFGEISRLSMAAQPTAAIITNVGVSHIENLGSREGILKAKLEILDGLEKGAPLILNGDNDLLSTVATNDYNVVFFSVQSKCDVTADNISEENGKTSFDVSCFGKSQHIIIPTVGIHNVYNALAAFTAGHFLGVDGDAAAEALSKYEPQGMRQRSVTVGGITSVEDCYNASPDSMYASLKTLGNMNGGKKIAVLADMLELGDYSLQAHLDVGKAVADNKIDLLLTYGEMGESISRGARQAGLENVYHFDSKEALADLLCDIASPGDAVLFKASRGMRLEDVIHIVYDRWENK